MATTTPTEFTGTPALDDEKVETIKRWYETALGDEDKAGDVEDACFYEGFRSACESVLMLLHDMPIGDKPDEPDDMAIYENLMNPKEPKKD